jgi:hypothetical protein
MNRSRFKPSGTVPILRRLPKQNGTVPFSETASTKRAESRQEFGHNQRLVLGVTEILGGYNERSTRSRENSLFMAGWLHAVNDSNFVAVTIVSGLPRAGTSMLMQMLEAGGLPVLTDGVRSNDDDNLRGYYEYEPVKSMRRDASWLRHAAGKAVKVIYLLLKDLPPQYEYSVIFTRRDLQEVVRSQQVMLDRRHQRGANVGPQDMIQTFQRQLQALDEWLETRPNFRRLNVEYRDVVANPRAQSRRIVEFLGIPLDIEAMAAVVEPALYRQRSS